MDFCTRSGAISGISRYLAASQFLGCTTANVDEPIPPVTVIMFAMSTASSSMVFRHKTIFVADLGDGRLALRRSLPIVVETAGEGFVAYSYHLEELASGTDESS